MARITEAPPPEVVADIEVLKAALDDTVPAKRLDHNLLVATWNLRAFGGLTEEWHAGPDDSPRRDLHSLLAIAEIVSRFDVVALQEVRGNLKALRHMLKALGSDWSFILTDVTRGAAGNDERMAFVFDTRRVKPSGLAAELVLPPEWHGQAIADSAATRQFARTPYAVSFASTGRGYQRTFILVTLHVLYGSSASGRTGELKAIAEWLAAEARDVNAYDHNLIALGDFNIDRKDDPNYQAFVSTGLRVPAELHDLPRTIFPGEGSERHYDQVAWFTGESGAPALSIRYAGRGGHVDFVGRVLADHDLDRQSLSWKISDHYPLWVEFLVQ